MNQILKDDLETRTLLRCDRGATLLYPSSSSFLDIDEDSLVAFENLFKETRATKQSYDVRNSA